MSEKADAASRGVVKKRKAPDHAVLESGPTENSYEPRYDHLKVAALGKQEDEPAAKCAKFFFDKIALEQEEKAWKVRKKLERI